MLRPAACLLVLLLLGHPHPSTAAGLPAPGMDPTAGRACAVGLARVGLESGSLSRSMATDVATHDARLGLRRLLYGLPVLEETTLAAALIRSSTLAAGLDRVIDAATTADSRMVPPDVVEVRVLLDLSTLHLALAPLLLARDGELPAPAGEAPPPTAPARTATAVAILPPPGAGYVPALLPLLGSRDAGRADRLRRGLGRHLLGGGTALHPGRNAATVKEATLRIEADAVGGLGRGTLYLTDRDADRVIEALEKTDRPILLLVADQPQNEVAAESAR